MPTPQDTAPAQDITPPDPAAGGTYTRDPVTWQLSPDPGAAVTPITPETPQE